MLSSVFSDCILKFLQMSLWIIYLESKIVITEVERRCLCEWLLLLFVVWLFQSCPSLFDPMDCSLPGSFVHGILRVRVLEWLSCPPPRDLPNPRIEPRSPTLQADSLLLSDQGSSAVNDREMKRITISYNRVTFLMCF